MCLDSDKTVAVLNFELFEVLCITVYFMSTFITLTCIYKSSSYNYNPKSLSDWLKCMYFPTNINVLHRT
jgi:hypothetical protein